MSPFRTKAMVVARDGAREPSWSRTNRLAVVIRTGTTDDIHVATAAAGSSFTQWTTGGATKPSWSGEGDGLAFQTRRAGNADIYTIATAGGSLSPVSTGPDEDTAPAW